MKYKVLKNDEGHFAVQYKYKYWPFYFWLTNESGPSDIPQKMVFKSIDVALDYVKQWEKDRKKEEWTVVWP